ncbi:hypothetical protein AMELA_G00247660 [Ameiurus melas]|uniref:Uncharacterized protein n=1 Tax=Ameiurus melas TaxID=219545 RepID=A0A7J5ZT97_AMEME|nr:hypothetical protein AMELA_G00247660 [Ameiurus melas]
MPPGTHTLAHSLGCVRMESFALCGCLLGALRPDLQHPETGSGEHRHCLCSVSALLSVAVFQSKLGPLKDSRSMMIWCRQNLRPLPPSVPQAPRRSGSQGLVYCVNSGRRAHMACCILCAHHRDTLYLTLSNCRSQEETSKRTTEKSRRAEAVQI